MDLLSKDAKNLWLKLGTDYSMKELDSEAILYRNIGKYELQISKISHNNDSSGMTITVRCASNNNIAEEIHGIKNIKVLKMHLCKLIHSYLRKKR